MTQTPIVHDFKELGTLQLESGKTTNSEEGGTIIENHWMRANFEALMTGAIYCAEIDDDQIRKYCTILSADPDLLNDFLVVKPSINVLPQAVMAEFTLRLGSKTYGFIVQIPKFTPEGSLAEVVELHQKNNVLVRRIKTLEERIMKQENNIIMLTDLCMPQCLVDHYADSYLRRCIEMTCEVPHRFDMMIHHIKTHTSKVGTHLLEMIKNGKLPKLREYIVGKNKEIYLALIGQNMQCINYVDKILCFCQLEIKMDHDITYNGQCYFFPDGFDKPYQERVVKYTMLEYFNHQVTNYIPGFYRDDTDYKIIIKSPEFSKKCNEIRTLLIKLNEK